VGAEAAAAEGEIPARKATSEGGSATILLVEDGSAVRARTRQAFGTSPWQDESLFSSGHTDDAIVHDGVLQSNTLFLQKPFTPQALVRKLCEALDS
jgi:hypothetical protein